MEKYLKKRGSLKNSHYRHRVAETMLPEAFAINLLWTSR